MKNSLLTLTLFFISVFTFAQKMTLDSHHAKLQFVVTRLTISNIDGEFKKFNANLNYSKENFSDAKFTITADATSIDTGVEGRDNHLKGVDFFYVEKYPSLKFVTTSFTQRKKNNYKLVGNLTMHGITKPITLNVKYNGNVIAPVSKKENYGFTITGSFKRSDFNIGSNFPNLVISDEVQILSNLVFTTE